MTIRLAEAALALALIGAVGWPAAATVATAFTTGSAPGGGLLGGSEEGLPTRPLGLAATTLQLVVATEALALPIALPLALLLFRTDMWGRRPLLVLMAVSAFVPLPLHATAWLGAFGNLGRAQALGLGGPVLTGLMGAAVVHALAALPWLVLLAGVGLRTVEPELEESALLDLPAWRVLVTVTLRRSLGALAGATLAVAVLTAGDMTVTDLLRVRTYAEEAYVQFQLNGAAAAARVAVPPLVVLGVLVVWAARGLLRADPARLASAARRGRVWRLGRWRVPVGAVVLVAAGNLVALPVYALLWRAGRVGGSAVFRQGPRWSLAGLAGTLGAAGAETLPLLVRSALWAGVGATATAAVAWGLAWASRRPGGWRWVAAVVVALTLAAPGPVAGMALVLAYRSIPVIYDSAAMLVLASVARTLPYALLVLWPAVRSLPPEHLDAAALDGYGPWGQVRRVALPLTRGALVAAWGVAFVLALGELPATILVAPPGVATLSVVIWGLLHTGVESHLAGVALVMLAVMAAAGALATWALGRVESSDS